MIATNDRRSFFLNTFLNTETHQIPDQNIGIGYFGVLIVSNLNSWQDSNIFFSRLWLHVEFF